MTNCAKKIEDSVRRPRSGNAGTIGHCGKMPADLTVLGEPIDPLLRRLDPRACFGVPADDLDSGAERVQRSRIRRCFMAFAASCDAT